MLAYLKQRLWRLSRVAVCDNRTASLCRQQSVWEHCSLYPYEV